MSNSTNEKSNCDFTNALLFNNLDMTKTRDLSTCNLTWIYETSTFSNFDLISSITNMDLFN